MDIPGLIYTKIPEKVSDKVIDRLEMSLKFRGIERYEKWNKIRKIQFMVGRALLQKGLDSVFPGTKVTLEYNKHGKPYIPGSSFSFSIAHCQNLVLCGFSLNSAIGVDVEKENRQITHLKRKILSEKERKHHVSDEDLFEIWTIKEAYLKAIGTGLTTLPSSITIRELKDFQYSSGKLEDNFHYSMVLCASSERMAYPIPKFVEFRNL